MKRLVFPVVVAAVLALGPAAEAHESNTVNAPEAGSPRTPRIEGSGRTPGTGRTEGTGRTPGTGRTLGTGRTPGTGRTLGTGRTGGTFRSGEASRLPNTGVDASTIAFDGLTLLGAGFVMLQARRRLATR